MTAKGVRLPIAIPQLRVVMNAKRTPNARTSMAERMQSIENKFVFKAPVNCAEQMLTAKLCFRTMWWKTRRNKSVS